MTDVPDAREVTPAPVACDVTGAPGEAGQWLGPKPLAFAVVPLTVPVVLGAAAVPFVEPTPLLALPLPLALAPMPVPLSLAVPLFVPAVALPLAPPLALAPPELPLAACAALAAESSTATIIANPRFCMTSSEVITTEW